MTAAIYPGGLTFHYVYDSAGRCVETWGDYEDGRPDPALAANLPELLADGRTRAKGIYHNVVVYGPDGYSECVSSTEVKRLFGNEMGTLDKAVQGAGVVSRTYDALGFETSKTDPSGATWITERDERGRPIRFVSPRGDVKTVTRNEQGRPTEIVDERGHTRKLEYDLRGNVVREIDYLGGMTVLEHDDRGLLVRRTGPSGASRQMVYDRFANLIEVRGTTGATHRYEHDGFGFLTAEIDPDGARREFRRSRRGDVVATVDELGRVTRYETDARRNVRRIVHPDGAAWELIYSGIDWLGETRRPTGEVTKIRFDRDGKPVEWQNPKGEVHTFEYDASGIVTKETTFDGREYSFDHDARGLTVREQSSHGTSRDYEYDEAGNLLKSANQDGDEITYEWDPTSRLAAFENEHASVQIERDAAGDVVGERQDAGGEVVLVKTTYDVGNNRVRVQTSLGYDVEVHREIKTGHRTIVLGGAERIRIENDINGLEARRRLAGGGLVRTERDPAGRAVLSSTFGPDAALVTAGQPEWVGGPRPGVTQRAYAWSVSGELVGIDDSARGSTRIDYDLRGRLTSYEAAGLPPERFAYDPNGNVLPEKEACTYERGDRLVRRGSVEFVHDAGGRLIEKRVPGPLGGVLVWRYTWLGSDLLGKVERPDGLVIEFQYDAIARRLVKTVRDPQTEIVERTRYVYSEDLLLQEVTTRTQDGKTVRVRRRDYVFYGYNWTPLAHVDVTFDERGEEAGRAVYHYVTDPFGYPLELVDGRGKTACRLIRRAFAGASFEPGALTTTPVRKMGQYCDPETGLHYNRYRYYDPDLGRFISPDPQGLHGGANAYATGNNPFRWDDPFGLTEESDRAALLKQNDSSLGKDCYAVGKLENGETIITRNSDSNIPGRNQRDDSDWPGQRKPGEDNPGAIQQGEFAPTKGTGDKSCDHAEQRMIREAEKRGTKIESVSATNNCCDKCKAKLIEHNEDIVITDPNGQQVHP
jgi:RHS repeat-associated protein